MRDCIAKQYQLYKTCNSPLIADPDAFFVCFVPEADIANITVLIKG